ncbi:trehalose-6-phosphate synthase [Mesorhizobium sp. M1C.F.Ca.ET.193.01.1.1]|uniref:alpha,alpha-trehalose-phosphate synthase (UDP-forming) n=1 Tax=unclassified Mesorhizobium TaxID=325217 RepID=UPI000FD5DCCB|nr:MULTISPECIES: trehalose-6-phosphate synthase [unclassified Mesorhizobium]TGS98976.1 trehalose-6-phosphate synthase [bacterium M00.F.Ca.ET.177.01.1.1]TGQ53015.1 trehalose-6-phosphate synthase [Mesorhizobium sp. M1C.F.Ca.ET.210.01.1.1]TGQ70294.1 trehalose-6-phosphate synthase [Mesorhizobium sp. M1C.F.Ca.ET.212.01.1.1]TGR06623.1 trehalose-6-phosphate synthase [Mesorhizobium sp. M1C.F.Ca.ET.204.01.1.1]TGR27146.1 trehalose-6-phosphate synthase [Mesorhizobium sp. M1C.F.Ca.ET.196.01.1.1]
MTQYGVDLSWVLILASLGLSALAIFVSVARHRHQRSKGVKTSASGDDVAPEAARKVLREFEKNGQSVDAALVNWSPETLRKILAEDLPDAQVIVVSNREPYIHNEDKNGDVKLVVPASGLVSALEPITRACAGTWIAYGGGSADHVVVDANDRVQVPPRNPSYTLRRVWLTEEQYQGYYLGFANEGLWPLCHIAFTRPIFRDSDWEAYEAVNRKFADTVVAEARNERPIVLVQDYHFALLPRMIRERLPEAIVITFWHIPWPNSEVFSICPWRERILDGLLGSSIIGFHTQFHANNFTESVDRFMESRIERADAAISFGGQMTLVHAYPISIEWPVELVKSLPGVEECRTRVRKRFRIPADARLCVGVERLDYTKGILDRFQALEELFSRHPEMIGKVVFLQIAAPSRGTLPAYKHLHDECLRYASELNERFGDETYHPVVMVAEHHSQAEVYEFYRAADICLVTSLHDGMNLVAKEFVAARDDEQGVLLLSTFAGASRELLEALIVNPYDAAMMSEIMLQALTMGPDEQRERMRRMREIVRDNNVYRWAGSMLLDAARLRKRDELDRVTALSERPANINRDNVVSIFERRQAAGYR